jgi:hypothetical protein
VPISRVLDPRTRMLGSHPSNYPCRGTEVDSQFRRKLVIVMVDVTAGGLRRGTGPVDAFRASARQALPQVRRAACASAYLPPDKTY